MILKTGHIGGGFHNYVVKDPCAQVIEREALERGEIPPLYSGQLRCEVFWGLLGYVFADGPHPVDVIRRFYAAVRGADYPGLQQIPSNYYRDLIDGAVGTRREKVLAEGYIVLVGHGKVSGYGPAVEEVLDKNRERIAHHRQFHWGYFPLADLVQVRSEDGSRADGLFYGLFDFYMKHGCEAMPVLRMLYVVAKSLREDLIGGMSLESLAVLSGDGGRATVSARIIRDYNNFIESDEGKAVKAYFQKTTTVCEKYRKAQKGNKNRIEGAKKQKRQGRGGKGRK